MSPYENIISSGLERAKEAVTGRRRVATKTAQPTTAETSGTAAKSTSFRGLNQAPPQRPLDVLLNQASSRIHTAATSFSPESEAALEDAFRQSFSLSPFQKALSDLSPSLAAQKIGELARGIYSAVESTGNLDEADKGKFVTELQHAVEDAFAATREQLETRSDVGADTFQELNRTNALTRQAMSHLQADVLSGAFMAPKQSTVSPEFSVAFAQAAQKQQAAQPQKPLVQASSINSALGISSQFAASGASMTATPSTRGKVSWYDGPAETTSELWLRGQRRVAYQDALFLK